MIIRKSNIFIFLLVALLLFNQLGYCLSPELALQPLSQQQSPCFSQSQFAHTSYLSKLVVLIPLACILASCALMGRLMTPDLKQIAHDRFYQATDHKLLKTLYKKERLGYINDNGVFRKKVWGGKRVEHKLGQSITLTYKKEDFDKLKLLFGSDLSIGPGLGNVHHVIVKVEDITLIELVNPQPHIQYWGDDEQSRKLLNKPFVVSMIKASKFSIEAYSEETGEFGAVYKPYPSLTLKASTGTSSQQKDSQVTYNAIIGFKTAKGSEWISTFEDMQKTELWLLSPKDNITINRTRFRVKGSIMNYKKLGETAKNKLSLYVMTRSEYEDTWTLHSKLRVTHEGYFEGVGKLGELEKGDGQRYSIAIFATYWPINRKVNSKIPHLPFNKGKFIINVTRRDQLSLGPIEKIKCITCIPTQTLISLDTVYSTQRGIHIAS